MTQKLPYPDKGRREPGAVQKQTIEAMRRAKGDRHAAARQLGISLNNLAKRLCVIRAALSHE